MPPGASHSLYRLAERGSLFINALTLFNIPRTLLLVTVLLNFLKRSVFNFYDNLHSHA